MWDCRGETTYFQDHNLLCGLGLNKRKDFVRAGVYQGSYAVNLLCTCSKYLMCENLTCAVLTV